MKTFVFNLMAACSLFAGAVFAEDIKDNATGVTFPAEVTIEHDGKQYDLQATGVSTRKKLIVKVYSVASYLQDANSLQGGNKFEDILSDDKAKQLTIKWVHDVPADKVQSGYQESFKTAFSEGERATSEADINKYLSFFRGDVKKGDEHIIRSLPGGYVEVLVNGNKEGSLTSPEFARGLWKVWFGNKSVVNRDNLVSRLK